MELGNMIFGHSRGNFPIKRGIGFEEELYRLFDAINPDRDNSWREYGENFENDTFMTFPYWWGDCECGFDDKDYEWSENNQCKESCFSVRREKFDNELKSEGISLYNDNSEEWKKRMTEWALKNGFTGWEGSGGHCDCGYNEEYNKWRETNNHNGNCPIVKPNFKHKPTGFEIQWYKYPLRDSYMNNPITLKDFSKLIDDCILSLNK